MSGRRPFRGGGRRGYGGISWWRGRGRGNYEGQRNNPYSSGAMNPCNSGNSSSSSQTLITSLLPPVDCPYKGWSLYLFEGYKENSEIVTFVKSFQKYIRKSNPDSESKRFLFDVQELLNDEDVKDAIPDLATLVINSPHKVIDSFGLAAYQVLYEKISSEDRENAIKFLEQSKIANIGEETINEITEEIDLPVIRARPYNLPKLTPLKDLKASYYGKLVSLKGTVVRVGNIKPICTLMAFSCVRCSGVIGVRQPDGKYTLPNSCPAGNCRSRSFTPQLSHKLTKTVDMQSMRLQEINCDDQREGGRVPRTVDCELTEDLVDSCIPGDMITITGIVKVLQNEENKSNKGEKCMFQLYIDCVSVINSRLDGASSTDDFCEKDYELIRKIGNEPELFKLLVGSLCPAIYGHELVKAGLLLCMFGGTNKNTGDLPHIRSDPHILVVGDPGLGKSQMLQACANVAPRGVYVCGNTTTTSGLTVTLNKEPGTGDYALEGGALVLADQGVCCIDEFDKMGTQHQALLEAMEQQCISIAKAGIVASLPARTSILAAANPVGGHYNKAKTVSENLKMNSALLSRFDLVFILLDKPDGELDCLLSEHVMALHVGGGQKRAKIVRPNLPTPDSLNTPSKDRMEKPLSERLKYKSDNYDAIPHQLIRKYILYARKYCHPLITPEACVVLQKFYLELRKRHQSHDSTPITTRQLESLIRLTQARAKIELREDATEEDAYDVIDIMKSSMIDTYSDELGFLDFQRSFHGSGTSSKGKTKKFIAALQKIADESYKSIFNYGELQQIAQQMHLKISDFGEFVAGLNHEGFLLKKGPKIYQLLTANC